MKIFGHEVIIRKIEPEIAPGRSKIELDFLRILYWKSAGWSNRKIADELGVSEGTIRNRLKEIEQELGY